MIASPNHVSPGGSIPAGDLVLIGAAGPLITIAQGVAGFWLVRKARPVLGFALLHIAFFMRLLAAALGFSNPNDEARVSQLLGLGTWTVPLIVVVGLFFLFLAASRMLELRFRDQMCCFLVASAVISSIIGVDTAFWPRA